MPYCRHCHFATPPFSLFSDYSLLMPPLSPFSPLRLLASLSPFSLIFSHYADAFA
jgi:hypothetical protein